MKRLSQKIHKNEDNWTQFTTNYGESWKICNDGSGNWFAE